MYNFTNFAMALNELEPGMEGLLAPTDCRLRPDIRAMENGNMGNEVIFFSKTALQRPLLFIHAKDQHKDLMCLCR